jgi:hypothetical protein
MKSKPWMTLEHNVARCSLCGGVSRWVPGYVAMGATGRERLFGYWKWWDGFKKAHAHRLRRNARSPNEALY